jgi:alpha-tubulin suppressor-like RCC1 family protein
VPVQVLGGDDWDTITVGTPGGQAGSDHTCATKSDGSAWCWGEGYYGALGIGEVEPGDTVRKQPTAVDSTEDWQLLVGGARHTCGIADDAALWCWGRYNNGQLGTSLLQSHYSPDVVVEDGPWRMVGPGELHTCGTKVDNTGWCWGSNGWKQLGPATSAAESLVPLQVPGSWASLDAGDFATCGVRTDGKAFCWGKSFNGGLGDVSTTDSASPVPVLG